MKKLLLETSFSKIYMIVMIIITLLILGGYFSYAMFTVSKEKGNAISIVTGNLIYDLKVDGTTGNTLTVKANRSREFEVTLTNPNNRTARFNFYYLGDISSEVNIGYLESDGYNKTPEAVGVNLEKSGSSGSSNVYRILVENESDNDISIELGVSVGLDYNDLSLEDNEHLFTKIELPNVLDQLLVTNKVQTEKDNMFNYTSKGDIYKDATSGKIENDPDYVTNGLYSMNDEDGISYYYRGNIENNNVQFGEYTSDYYVYNLYDYEDRYFQSLESCQEYKSSCSESNRVKLASAGDKMYWKIVRVNGDGSLRLIYNGTSPNHDNSDLAHSYAVGITPYNIAYNEPKYTGYTYDNGIDSFIKKEVDTWYENALGNTVYDKVINSGRFCSDSSGFKNGNEFVGEVSGYEGLYVYAIYERISMSIVSYDKPNSPTLICPDTNETYGGSYSLKAGLITSDELVLAGGARDIEGNDYLKPMAGHYWTMTPSDFYIIGRAYVGSISDSVDVHLSGNISGIRPVINVSIDNGFTSGDGTLENPYMIS